jgi:clan AA aspartic protease (TIGR02281 family)
MGGPVGAEMRTIVLTGAALATLVIAGCGQAYVGAQAQPADQQHAAPYDWHGETVEQTRARLIAEGAKVIEYCREASNPACKSPAEAQATSPAAQQRAAPYDWHGETVEQTRARLIAEGANADMGSRPATVQVAARPTAVEVPVRRNQSGLYEVRATINGMGSFTFEIDSGATLVTIPANGFIQMVNAGMIQKADYQGKAISTLADGSSVVSLVFHLASMSVGGRTVNDVRCLVVKDGGSYLLGQSFLAKFRSWSIDNVRNVLLLEG